MMGFIGGFMLKMLQARYEFARSELQRRRRIESLRWPESKLERREMASTSHLALGGRSRNCAFFAGCRASITFTPTGYKITGSMVRLRASVSSFCMHGAALASACQFLPLTCVRIPSPSRSSVKAPCRPVNESSSLYNCGKNTERDAIAATCAALVLAARER